MVNSDTEEYEDYCRRVEEEVYRDFLSSDCVATRISYTFFVSKSKGWRNGKRLLRRNWKEIHLIQYCGWWWFWERFPFDVYATEVIGPFADGEMLRQRIIDLWGY